MAEERVTVRLESEAFAADRTRIAKLKGREAIGSLYRFEVDFVALGADPLGALPGAEVDLVFERQGIEERRISGMFAELHDRLDSEPDHRRYFGAIVPRAFRMTLAEMQEVLVAISIPDAIKRKLELVGFGKNDFELRLGGSYADRDLVVQFRESDYAFIARWAEHFGISLFVEQVDRHDVLVLTDRSSGFRQADAIYFRKRGDEKDVYQLEVQSRLVPAFFAVHDYNEATPQLDLMASYDLPSGDAGGVVEYGAHVATPDESKVLARIRAEERLATQVVYVAKTDLPAIAAGQRRTLSGHPTLDQLALVIVEVEHELEQPVGLHGSSAHAHYESRVRAVPLGDQTYRPPRVTPRPRIDGLLTGMIEERLETGVERGTRIDDEGRYMVRLLFDTSQPGEAKTSCPVRMLQSHAGPNYGIHFPLKPGVEVLVGFVDGNPDRPVIAGAVPNPMTPSPVTSAGATTNRIQTVSGILIEFEDA